VGRNEELKMSLLGSHPGLSIIVTSYQRMEALYANLSSLLDQDLRGLPHEIIVVNNAHQVNLRPHRWSKLGRLFRAHPEIKLLNSRYNWRVYLRYGMAYIATYDSILFLDDDIHCLDSDIVYDMHRTLMKLEPYDIVSCWNMLWSHWTDNEHHHVSATLFDSELTELTKTDTCGPGISMFNRQVILDAGARKSLITWSIPDVGDMALGLLSHMIWGGTTYAMPMYRRVAFSPEHKKHALHETEPNFVADRYRLFKEMYEQGYQPVITRGQLAPDSPEMKLIRRREATINRW
jgi:hypothetical protein